MTRLFCALMSGENDDLEDRNTKGKQQKAGFGLLLLPFSFYANISS